MLAVDFLGTRIEVHQLPMGPLAMPLEFFLSSPGEDSLVTVHTRGDLESAVLRMKHLLLERWLLRLSEVEVIALRASEGSL